MAETIEAVNDWHTAVLELLSTAEAAAPLNVAAFDSLTFDRPRVRRLFGGDSLESAAYSQAAESSVDEQVEGVIDKSENALSALLGSASTLEEGASLGLSILAGTLEAGQALLMASEEPELVLGAIHVDGTPDFSGSVALLDELRAGLFGEPLPGVEVPANLRAELEKLEVAGTGEFVELAQETLLWNLLGAAVKGIGDLDRTGNLKEAFAWVKKEANWLREKSLRLVEWTLRKLRDLIPKHFREAFDEKLDDIKEAIESKDVEDRGEQALENVVGVLMGRMATETMWQKAVGKNADLVDAEKQVAPIVSRHIRRIEGAAAVRSAASKAATLIMALVKKLAAAAGPYGAIIVGALAVLVLAFVGYQMWAGFNDIERLATAALAKLP